MTLVTNHTLRSAMIPVVVALLISTLVGCIKEDRSNCPPPEPTPPVVREEVLRVRAVDLVSGADISESGTVADASLYVFDENGNFITHIDVRGAQLGDELEIPISLTTRAAGDVLNLSAWGNIRNNLDFEDTIDYTDHLDSVFLDLKTSTTDDDYAAQPGNIFFGFKTITLGQEDTRAAADTIVHTVDITQKAARLHIVVRGLPADAGADDYYFTLGRVSDGLDFRGNPVNDDNRRIKATAVFNTAHELVSPRPYYLLPSMEPDNATSTTAETIRLWKVGDNPDGSDDVDLTGRVNTDSEGNYIGLNAGETTNVLIVFTDTGNIEVRIRVTPWNEVYQWSTWPY